MADRQLGADGNHVRVVPGENGMRVVLTGDVDYASRGQLDDAYLALTEHPPGPVVADLANTTFLDSVGLGFLVQLHQWAADRGHGLTLESPPRHVRRALTLTGLDRVLTITPE
jgi:anti-anti-sigma factor